jgi:hypothetical protein
MACRGVSKNRFRAIPKRIADRKNIGGQSKPGDGPLFVEWS